MGGNRNRNPIRKIDLNLYLGLPRRRPEPELGLDLALGSLPSSAEMSSSQSDSYLFMNTPVVSSQSTQIPVVVRSNVPEYNPYSPSYDHVSSNPETLGNELFDDTFLNPPFLSSFVGSSPTVQDSTEAALHEGSNSNDAEYVPYSIPAYAPVSLSTPNPASESQTQPEFPHVPYVPVSRTTRITSNRVHGNESSIPENRGFSPYQATDASRRVPLDRNRDDSVNRPSLLQYAHFRRLIDSNSCSLVRRLRASVPGVAGPDLDDYPPFLGSVFPERRDYPPDFGGAFPERRGYPPDLGGAFMERRDYPPDLSGAFPERRDYPPDLGGAFPERQDFPPDLGGAFPERPALEPVDETNCGSKKASVENLVAEDLVEKGSEDGNNGNANFDCNVCLDVAKEPVVTSCGHLFCWPCLYQWLHLHSDHKECPVCKGETTEANITPIYGRGNSDMGVEKKVSEGEDSSLKIPPRPRGHRTEGFTQRVRRPLGSWRLVVDDDTQNRGEGLDDSSVQGIFNGANSRVLTRLLAAHRSLRDLEQAMNAGGSGSARNVNEIASNHTEGGNPLPGVLHGGGSRSTPSALARRGIGFGPRFAFYNVPRGERLAAIASDLSNVVGRMRTGVSNSGASASAHGSNPLNVRGTSETVTTADQASASSTIAVIQGDNGGSVDAPAEPSSVGSSRIVRRRTRNSAGASSSLDVDGGVLHARKRRRLN